MGSFHRQGAVGLGHNIYVRSFFFSFPPHCAALFHLPPPLPMDVRPSSLSRAYHGPITDRDDNSMMAMMCGDDVRRRCVEDGTT